jgi:MoxR-like ATPase
MVDIATPQDLARALDATGYIADEGLATAAFLALRMGRPLFLEGEAGVGKTSLAHALASVLDAPLIRLQCYEGLDAAQALYDWDFPRQLLHLRAAEAAGVTDVQTIEHELYDRRFLLARPLLRAARRRDRPGRRRVRGVPARSAVRFHHHHPGDRHRPRQDAADGRGHEQPDP